MDSNPSSPGDLTLYVEKYLSLEQQGKSVSLEELCHDAPHLIVPLEREINAIHQVNQVLSDTNSPCESESPKPVGERKGTTVATHEYQLQRFHAHGGCSEIYLANDTQLGRTIAIKFLRPDVEGFSSYQTRLNREAEITSRLDHPGIVSIHARGMDEKGLPFYVMRFVDGDSLAHQIKSVHQANPNPPAIALRKLLNHFIDVCQTVAYAHSQGVIHRDLKPDNIVTGNYGETYLIDWGLAKQIDEPETMPIDSTGIAEAELPSKDETQPEFLTRLGQSMGTPAFMSPEQAAGDPAGKASDIFNLGATLYAILTGQSLYQGESLDQLIRDAKSTRFIPPEKVNLHLARPLAAICKSALQQNPKKRYQNANQMAEDIERFLADQPVSVYQDRWGEQARRWFNNHRTLVSSIATSGIAAIVILTASTFLLLDSNRKLAKRESEATFHKNEARKALEVATENLHGQQIALANTELNNNNLVRANEILMSIPEGHRFQEWYLLRWLANQFIPSHVIETGRVPVNSIDVSEDRQFIAFGLSNGRVFGGVSKGVNNGDWVPAFDFQSELEVACINFSPDGSRLAISGRAIRNNKPNGAIAIYNLNTNQVISRRWGQGFIPCIAWSHDGRHLATGGLDGSVKIRSAKTLAPTLRINDAHQGPVHDLRYVNQPAPGLLSTSEDGTLKFWDDEGNQLTSQMAHIGGTHCITAHQQTVYSAGKDGLIRQWSQKQSELVVDPLALVGNQDQVESIDISANGNYLASGGLDRVVRVWDLSSHRLVVKIRAHTSHVRQVKFGPEGKFLMTSGDDGGIKFWSIENLIDRMPYGGLVQFLGPTNELISADIRSVSLWDADQQKPVARQSVSSEVASLVASKTHPIFATMHFDGSVRIQRSGASVTLAQSGAPAMTGVFSNDHSQLVVGRRDGTLERWSLDNRELLQSGTVRGSIRKIGLTSDSQTLVVICRNGYMYFCDPQTLAIRNTIQAHSRDVLGLAIHPNQAHAATTGHDGLVKIWDLANGTEISSFRFGASWLNTLAYTPDGTRLITGSEHTVLIWDPIREKEVLAMSIDRCVHSIAFSQDGKFMAVAGEDPRVRVWQISESP